MFRFILLWSVFEISSSQVPKNVTWPSRRPFLEICYGFYTKGRGVQICIKYISIKKSTPSAQIFQFFLQKHILKKSPSPNHIFENIAWPSANNIFVKKVEIFKRTVY